MARFFLNLGDMCSSRANPGPSVDRHTGGRGRRSGVTSRRLRNTTRTAPLEKPAPHTVKADVPHFSWPIWPPTSGGGRAGVDGCWDVQEVKDLVLQWGQFGFEDLHDLVVADEEMTFDVSEYFQHAWRAGGGAVAQLGVEGEAGDLFVAYRGAESRVR